MLLGKGRNLKGREGRRLGRRTAGIFYSLHGGHSRGQLRSRAALQQRLDWSKRARPLPPGSHSGCLETGMTWGAALSPLSLCARD